MPTTLETKLGHIVEPIITKEKETARLQILRQSLNTRPHSAEKDTDTYTKKVVPCDYKKPL